MLDFAVVGVHDNDVQAAVVAAGIWRDLDDDVVDQNLGEVVIIKARRDGLNRQKWVCRVFGVLNFGFWVLEPV